MKLSLQLVLAAAVLTLVEGSNQRIWKRQYPADGRSNTFASPEMESMEKSLMVWLQKSMEQKVMAKFNTDMEKKLQPPDKSNEKGEGKTSPTMALGRTEFGQSAGIPSQTGNSQPRTGTDIVPQTLHIGNQDKFYPPTQIKSPDNDQTVSRVPAPPSGTINFGSDATQLPVSYYSPYYGLMYNNYPFQTGKTLMRGPLTRIPSLDLSEKISQSARPDEQFLHGAEVVSTTPYTLDEKRNAQQSGIWLTGQGLTVKPYWKKSLNGDRISTNFRDHNFGLSGVEGGRQLEVPSNTVLPAAKSIGDRATSNTALGVPGEDDWEAYRRKKTKTSAATNSLFPKTVIPGRESRQLDLPSGSGTAGKVTSFHYL